LPVVSYGCDTWSLTLREECRLRVFVNRVLKSISEPERDEVTGEWRRLHNEELYTPYSSSNIIRVMKQKILRWAGQVARMGREEVLRGLVRKPVGRNPLGRPRGRWEDNIKMNLRKSGLGARIKSIWLRLGKVAGCCECGDDSIWFGRMRGISRLVYDLSTSQEVLCSME
jgi:hypothetical protein